MMAGCARSSSPRRAYAERAELDRSLECLRPLSAGTFGRDPAGSARDVDGRGREAADRLDGDDCRRRSGQSGRSQYFEQYFAELAQRFETGFDPALSISADPRELTPPAGLLLVARLRQEPVGCAALKLHASAPAEIKRMWVAPRARGLGFGRRLLRALECQARGAGVSVLRLETNRTLTEAIALYRRAGYREVPAFNDEPYAHHWFEKRLL